MPRAPMHTVHNQSCVLSSSAHDAVLESPHQLEALAIKPGAALLQRQDCAAACKQTTLASWNPGNASVFCTHPL